MATATQTCTLDLPAGFRVADILKFHQRDALAFSERVDTESLHKGLVWEGYAACLSVHFLSDQTVAVKISLDGASTATDADSFARHVRRMLGLTQPVDEFEKAHARHPQLGALIARQRGLRVPLAASPFEALTWAIIGQQINLSFAISLRRTFILQAGRRHGSGLWCYPEARDVARLSVEDLTSRKFSRAKADTVLRLASLVDAGALSLELPPSGDVAAISQALLAVKGIGPWTVNYALLRGYGYADCSLHGDVAIRAALQKLLGEESKPDMARTEQWLRQYAPHRTMAAAHLWASLHAPGQNILPARE